MLHYVSVLYLELSENKLFVVYFMYDVRKKAGRVIYLVLYFLIPTNIFNLHNWSMCLVSGHLKLNKIISK